MKKCESCGAELNDYSKFCPECGKTCNSISNNKADNNVDLPDKLQKKKCPSCGADCNSYARFCLECGYKFLNDDNTELEIGQQDKDKRTKSKSSLSILIVVIVLVMALAAFVLVNNKSKDKSIKPNISSSSVSENDKDETTTEPTTTTASLTTTITTTTTTTTTTTAVKEVYASDLVKITKGKLLKKYFNNIYDTDYISLGQQNAVSLENTSNFPFYKVAFMYMEADEIPDNEVTCGIHVLPGGKINDKITIGMTYNELKEIYDFEGASLDGGTFGYTAWIKVNGVKWGIEFKLNTDDKARLGYPELGEPVDLSEINPPSDLGYYIESVQ